MKFGQLTLDREFMSKGWRFARNYIRRTFQRGRFRPTDKPLLSIETTNICNAKCVFCANPVMQRRKEGLSMELYRKAIDELAVMAPASLDFNVTIGDPLLDPKLVERARYVRDHHPQLLPIGFNTTLQFLHKFNLDDIFDCGIGWITVSTTLSGRERYVEFFGVDKYEQMMTNLITLLTENRSRGYPIDVQLSIKATDEPPETVLAHPDFRRIQELTLQDLENEVHNRGYFVDDWIGAVELPPYLKKRPLVPRAFRPCGQLYNGLMLYSNGKVGACCCRDFEASSELILGHVRENTLAEMWNGDNLARLRSEWKWKNRVPEICKGCRHYIY